MNITSDMKRIVRSGLINFYRNTFVSFASVLTMTITLMIVGSLLFVNAILSFTTANIERKVDINAYFYPNAPEIQILDLKTSLEQLPQVASVEYISRDDALKNFQERHKNDNLTLQALDELGTNPLGATLNIQAKDSGQYESIAKFLSGDDTLEGQSAITIIEKVNFNQNKEIIERLNNLSRTVQRVGIILTIIFVSISIIVTLNTIRMAIYSAREEIGVMRLVGAENKYIQGPFIVEGILSGLFAAVITIIVLFPLTLWLSKYTIDFFGGLSLVKYYGDNFIQMFIILLLVGITLGALSSMVAIRKYLKK
jgi:cell division transport system permease protein